MQVTYHEEVVLSVEGEDGCQKILVTSDSEDGLRCMLYEMREKVTEAIVRVEDAIAGV